MAKVKKPLISVAKMRAAGNRVYFDENPRFVNKSGQATRIREHDGMFLLDMWIKTDQGKARAPGFPRQG